MKKDNNILYFGVFFAASILAEIYCIIEKINIIGVSIVVLITTYLLLDAIRAEKSRNDEKIQNYYGERLSEIEKIQKALYIQIRKNTEHSEEKENERQELRKAGVSEIVEGQTRMAKIIVKYVREDINKATAIGKASSDKMIAALQKETGKSVGDTDLHFDSKEITESLDSNFSNLIGYMENRIKNIEEQLISLKQMPGNTGTERGIVDSSRPEGIKEDAAAETKIDEIEGPDVQSIAAGIADADDGTDLEAEVIDQPEILEATEVLEDPQPEVLDELEIIDKPQVIEVQETNIKQEEKKKEETAPDPNRPMSADEIAAMFADAGMGASTPEKTEEKNPEIKPEPNIKKEETMKEEESAPDANRQLSADEIAAMFASIGAEEEPAKPEPEPVQAADNADSNKQLSADEIAALFASIG